MLCPQAGAQGSWQAQREPPEAGAFMGLGVQARISCLEVLLCTGAHGESTGAPVKAQVHVVKAQVHP